MNEELKQSLSELKSALTLSENVSIVEISVYLVAGGLLALYLRFLYSRCGASASDADSFTRVFPLLTVITTGVIAVVKSSLALSLGLVGALSIVRFRAAIKEPEELVYLFLCIAVGLALGAEQPLLAVAMVLVATIYVVIMHTTGRRGRRHRMMLTVTGKTEPHFNKSDDGVLTVVREIAGPHTVHRMDLENGQGQVRIMLPRCDSDQVQKMMGDLRARLPECEFSYVNLDSNI